LQYFSQNPEILVIFLQTFKLYFTSFIFCKEFIERGALKEGSRFAELA
jgi:hypothetical protein